MKNSSWAASIQSLEGKREGLVQRKRVNSASSVEEGEMDDIPGWVCCVHLTTACASASLNKTPLHIKSWWSSTCILHKFSLCFFFGVSLFFGIFLCFVFNCAG